MRKGEKENRIERVKNVAAVRVDDRVDHNAGLACISQSRTWQKHDTNTESTRHIPL